MDIDKKKLGTEATPLTAAQAVDAGRWTTGMCECWLDPGIACAAW